MKKPLSILISLALVLGIFFLLKNTSKEPTTSNASLSNSSNLSKSSSTSPVSSVINNVVIKDGIQYITINAKRGYSPRTVQLKGGMPTKLVVKTDGTYDCSSSLSIPSIGYQEYLPATGTTEIDLGTKKSGDTIDATCGMGMYSFRLNFE